MPDIYSSDDLLEMAYPYVLDALPSPDRRAVERSLSRADNDTTATFYAIVRDISETLARMTEVDSLPAPPRLENALLRAIDTPASYGRPERARRMRPLLVAAAVLLLAAGLGGVLVGINGSSHHSSVQAGPSHQQSQPAGPPTSPPVTSINANDVFSHGDTRSASATVATGGTMTVSASHELDAAAVVFDAVPTAPEGRTYQLWVVDPDGQAKSAGTFDTLPTTNTPVLVHIGDAQEVAMSLEPTGGSQAPTDTQVAATLP